MALISMEAIQTVANRIAERFQPDKIILFGSYAYGEPHEHSDVDLLVIMPFEGSRMMMAAEMICTGQPTFEFSMDLILKTPERAQQGYQEYDPILRTAIGKGKVLYDRHA